MTLQRGIRQPRTAGGKRPFHILLDPALRQKLGEVAEDSGVSVAALITSWVEFLAHRYDSTAHLLLNQDEWGIEWRFTGGQLIWKVVSAHGRIQHMDEGAEDAASDRQEPTEDDLRALRHAANVAAGHVLEAVAAQQG